MKNRITVYVAYRSIETSVFNVTLTFTSTNDYLEVNENGEFI